MGERKELTICVQGLGVEDRASLMMKKKESRINPFVVWQT